MAERTIIHTVLGKTTTSANQEQSVDGAARTLVHKHIDTDTTVTSTEQDQTVTES